MVRLTEKRIRRAHSCCRVLVVKGGAGRRIWSRSLTSLTAYILRGQLGGDVISLLLTADIELIAVFGQKTRPERTPTLTAQKGSRSTSILEAQMP